MSTFALQPGHMTTAAEATGSVADDARRSDGSDELAGLAGALPGTTTADVYPELGSAWQTGVQQWSTEVDQFSASLKSMTSDATTTDGSAAGWLMGLNDRAGSTGAP